MRRMVYGIALTVLAVGCASPQIAMVNPTTGDTRYCSASGSGLIPAIQAKIAVSNCVEQLEALGYKQATELRSGKSTHLPRPAGELRKGEVIEKYFTGRDLDVIEGTWFWEDSRYEAAILKNSFGINPQYDYVGIIIDTRVSNWKIGETKLLIKKTASDSVYLVVYFSGEKEEYGTTLILPNENMIEILLPTGSDRTKEKILLFRTYPKRESQGRAVAEPETATGSCFAARPDGVLITAYHVVKGAKSIRVHFADGTVRTAKVRTFSAANDLAILRVESSTPQFLPLAPAGSVRVGDQVFTMGYPVAEILGQEPKFTDGAVSALSGVEGEASLLQISVPVQPGNSGGPLVNERGEVVGIVTSTAAVQAFLAVTGALPQNVNWAVKTEYARLLFDAPTVKSVSVSREEVIQRVRRAICMVETSSR